MPKILILLLGLSFGFIIGWLSRDLFSPKEQSNTRAHGGQASGSPEKMLNDIASNDVANQNAQAANVQQPDDLKKIKGIGPALEKQLHEMGITTFRQIASFTDGDVDRVARALGGFANRIRRDDWIEQARAQHATKYGERL
jgi:predicted flap endonuclease-1-like 5' DNA nuclease